MSKELNNSNHIENQKQRLNKLLKDTKQALSDANKKVSCLREELIKAENIARTTTKEMLAILNSMTELGIVADDE